MPPSMSKPCVSTVDERAGEAGNRAADLRPADAPRRRRTVVRPRAARARGRSAAVARDCRPPRRRRRSGSASPRTGRRCGPRSRRVAASRVRPSSAQVAAQSRQRLLVEEAAQVERAVQKDLGLADAAGTARRTRRAAACDAWSARIAATSVVPGRFEEAPPAPAPRSPRPRTARSSASSGGASHRLREQAVELGARQLLAVVGGREADGHGRACATVMAHRSVIRTSSGLVWMSITRQSPHIFRRSAAAPWNIAVAGQLARASPRSPAACRRACRTHAAERLGLVQHARRLARLAAVGQPQPRLQRDRVLGAGAGAQAALHAVLLDEAQLRPLGVVGQRASGQAPTQARHSVQRVGVDARACRTGAPAAAARSSRAPRGACAQQVVERQVERRALVGLHAERGRPARTVCAGGAAAAPRRARPHVARARSAAGASPRVAQAGRGSPAPPPSARPAPRGTRAPLRRSAAPRPGSRRSAIAASHRSMPTLAVCHTVERQHARRHAVHAVVGARRAAERRRSARAPAPWLCSSSAASRPPARCIGRRAACACAGPDRPAAASHSASAPLGHTVRAGAAADAQVRLDDDAAAVAVRPLRERRCGSPAPSRRRCRRCSRSARCGCARRASACSGRTSASRTRRCSSRSFSTASNSARVVAPAWK